MRYLIFFLLIVSLGSLSSCENDEVQPKSYPFVTTNSPRVDNEGTEFSANIACLGNHEIVKYGFVWSTDSDPTIQDYSILFDEEVSKGVYSCYINSGLTSGQKYYVRAYILTEQLEVYGNEKTFISSGSLPPVIDSFYPKYGSIGTKVIIEGKNFARSQQGNIIKFGNIVATEYSVNENKIEVTVPQITKPEKVQITIETAGMAVTSHDSFDLWFPWKRIDDFPWMYNYDEMISFSINDKGYYGLGVNKTHLWEFDPQKGTFIRMADFPKENLELAYPLCFTANNKGYVLYLEYSYYCCDADTVRELWEYDPTKNSWTQKADFPGYLRRNGTTFTINNKGYIVSGYYLDGRGYSQYPKDFWEYDPETNKWNRRSDFTGSGTFGFSYNGTGFVGSKKIYQYNPATDSWSLFGTYPGSLAYNVKGFIIDNKCYLGLGSMYFKTNGEFWELDIPNNSWKKMRTLPNNLSPHFAFSINNIGYIGVGWDGNQIFSKTLYEFNPLKN